MSERRRPPTLLGLSPGDLKQERSASWVQELERVWRGGLRGLVLREPGLDDRGYLQLAREVRRRMPARDGGWLCLHDRPHLVAVAGAQGVHLGGRSLPAAIVREWLDASCSIGLSTHLGDDPSDWTAADHLLHAPAFDVPGKGPALGASGLEWAVQRARVPVFGLGGVLPENLGQLLSAGCAGAAVLRGIWAGPGADARLQGYLAGLAEAGGERTPEQAC